MPEPVRRLTGILTVAGTTPVATPPICQSHVGKADAYGLTPEGVVVLYSGPVGASCGRPWGTSRNTQPVIDHDQHTGAMRGVTRGACNIGFGHFGDDPDRLQAAARYLQ